MTDRAVRYRIQADLGDFQAKMKQGSESAKKFGNDLMALDKNGAQMRANLSHVGDVAGRIGVVAAAGLGMAVKSAMDWETAWTGVLKTVDGSPAQLAKLEDGLRDLAKETGFAHAEVAAVAEAAGQLGISTGGVENFTRVMLDMGVSTSMSAEEAATGLARLRNIMGTTEAEIGNTGAAMVELGNNFATTEGEILAMSQRIAGAGRQAGLTTADVLGLSTAMSSVGIEAEAGGTAMSLTMKRIGKEVETGGDSLALFARVSGMTVSEFQQAWGQDAAGALTTFVAGLGQAEQIGMSTNEVLRELGVTGIRESDALLRLSGNAEGLAAALGTASDGWRENSALTEEAGKFYETSAQQVKQSWAAIKDAAIDAGAVMLPVVEGVANAVAGLAGAFQALPGPVKASVGPVLGLTAALGGGLWALSKSVTMYAEMRGALSGLRSSFDGVGKAGEDAATSMGKVGKAARIVGGITVAAVVGYQIAQAWRESASELQRYVDITTAMAGSDPTAQIAALNKELEKQRKIIDDAVTVEWGDGDHIFAPFSNGAIDAHNRAKALREQIAELEHQQKLSEYASDDAAGGFSGMGGAAGDAADEVLALTDAMKESRAEALRAADAEINYHAALDDARAALEENGRTLDVTTEKGRENRSALIDLAGSWNNLSDEQKNAQGASRSARAEFVRIATQMGMTKKEARQYADQLMEIPPKRVTEVQLDGVAEAEKQMDWLTRLRTATIQVRTTYGQQGGGDSRPEHRNRADGAVVDYYANGGLRENHVAEIAPAGSWRVWAEPETGGEAYIPLAPSKRDRSLEIWEETGRRLGALAFAGGGVVGAAGSGRAASHYDRLYSQRAALSQRVGARAGTAVYGDDIKAQAAEVRGLRQDVKAVEKAIKRIGQDVGDSINRSASTAQRRK